MALDRLLEKLILAAQLMPRFLDILKAFEPQDDGPQEKNEPHKRQQDEPLTEKASRVRQRLLQLLARPERPSKQQSTPRQQAPQGDQAPRQRQPQPSVQSTAKSAPQVPTPERTLRQITQRTRVIERRTIQRPEPRQVLERIAQPTVLRAEEFEGRSAQEITQLLDRIEGHGAEGGRKQETQVDLLRRICRLLERQTQQQQQQPERRPSPWRRLRQFPRRLRAWRRRLPRAVARRFARGRILSLIHI